MEPVVLYYLCCIQIFTVIFSYLSATLVHKQHRVDLKTAVKLRRAVIVVSWISIIVLVVLGIATFGKYIFHPPANFIRLRK